MLSADNLVLRLCKPKLFSKHNWLGTVIDLVRKYNEVSMISLLQLIYIHKHKFMRYHFYCTNKWGSVPYLEIGNSEISPSKYFLKTAKSNASIAPSTFKSAALMPFSTGNSSIVPSRYILIKA